MLFNEKFPRTLKNQPFSLAFDNASVVENDTSHMSLVPALPLTGFERFLILFEYHPPH